MPRPFTATQVGLFAGAMLLLGTIVPGCGRSSTGGGPENSAGRKYSIAVIPKGTTNEFWKSVHAGAVNAAMELGDIEILWKGPQLESDLAQQIQVVQDFQTRGVDGICLAPLDSQALVPYVEEAAESDIPIVIFDSALADESYIVSYVATDNYRGGVLAAERMAEVLGGNGNVIMLRYAVGSESTEQREAGFLETLEQKYPDINVLSSDQYAGETADKAYNKAMQVFPRYRDQIDGVFAVNESNANGVLGALRELGLAGKVKFIAFDPNADLIRGLSEGTVHGIVLQDPVTMGYEAVKAMHAHLKGTAVEKRIQTGEHVATPENMDDPEMKKLLHPQQFEG